MDKFKLMKTKDKKQVFKKILALAIAFMMTVSLLPAITVSASDIFSGAPQVTVPGTYASVQAAVNATADKYSYGNIGHR